MRRHTRRYFAPDEKGFALPGEGPSADRLAEAHEGHPEVEDESMAGHVVFNQDGTRLGSWEGGSVANPTGSGIGDLRRHGEFVHAEPDHQPIGADTTVLPENGERRTFIPGIAGGASEGDRGTSGHLGGDASNVGIDGDDQYGE